MSSFYPIRIPVQIIFEKYQRNQQNYTKKVDNFRRYGGGGWRERGCLVACYGGGGGGGHWPLMHKHLTFNPVIMIWYDGIGRGRRHLSITSGTLPSPILEYLSIYRSLCFLPPPPHPSLYVRRNPPHLPMMAPPSLLPVPFFISTFKLKTKNTKVKNNIIFHF